MAPKLLKNFYGRINRALVSDRLLEESFIEARRRAPILIGMLSISAGSALMLSAALLVLFVNKSEWIYLAALAIALITFAGYVATLRYFKRTEAWLPTSYLYAITTTFSTIAPCLITGGLYSSPYLPLTLVVPVFLFLLAGRVHGLYWSVATGLCVGVMFMLEIQGVSFPQAIPDAYLATFRFAMWIATLSLLVLGLISYEVNFEKLTERISAERSQFAHDAMHDPLTGLSNRKLFYVRAREAVEYALKHDHKAAILFIDVNNFKTVNDSFGHEVGDDVLNTMAERLRDNIRSSDTVSRLGGDEFAVVLHGINEIEAAETMIAKLSDVLNKPLAVGNTILRVSASFGSALAPDQGIEVSKLLQIADKAMYQAKEASREPQRTAC